MKIENPKIALVSAQSYSEPGGVQNHIIELYNEFKKRGYECKIIAPGKDKPNNVDTKDVINIGISKRIPANGSRTDISLSLNRKTRRRISDENFDIMHFHNMSLGPLTLQILHRSNALNILTLHVAGDGSKLLKAVPFMKSLFRMVYEKKFHGVIGVSPTAYEGFKGYYSNGPVAIIPNGINLERFTPHPSGRGEGFRDQKRETSRFGSRRRNILFVGRLEKRKGVMHLLNAYELLVRTQNRRDLQLTIVGDGEERQRAKKFVKKNDLAANVAFMGYASDDALITCYRDTDIFCAPAMRGESFGITLLEAMASGTPVTGFANPGYSWVMRGHEDAVGDSLLVSPGDYRGLAQKIELLSQDSALYERARNWGLQECKKFSWPHIADEVLNFYQEAHEHKKAA